MPMGDLLSIYACFSGKKKNFNVYFSGKRRSLVHSNMAQRSFFPLQSLSRETYEKIGPKSPSILDHAHAPWASHNTP